MFTTYCKNRTKILSLEYMLVITYIVLGYFFFWNSLSQQNIKGWKYKVMSMFSANFFFQFPSLVYSPKIFWWFFMSADSTLLNYLSWDWLNACASKSQFFWGGEGEKCYFSGLLLFRHFSEHSVRDMGALSQLNLYHRIVGTKWNATITLKKRDNYIIYK